MFQPVESHGSQRFRHSLFDQRRRQALVFQGKGNLFKHSQRNQLTFIVFHYYPYATGCFRHTTPGGRLPFDQDLAGQAAAEEMRYQAGHRQTKRGFAAAVGAGQYRERTIRNGERDAVQPRAGFRIMIRKIFKLDCLH